MSELELVRDLYPEGVPDPAARDRVRAAVAARTLGRRRQRLPRRPLVPAVGTLAAAAAAAMLVLVLTGTSATVDAAAARVLHRAARAARHERSLAALGPGQYLYTKSVDANLDTTVDRGVAYSALVPHVRRIWLRRDGTGWLYQTSGAPSFLSDRDRQAWIAADRPSLGDGVMDVQLGPSGGPTAPMASLDLPADPAALYAKLHEDASGFGDRIYTEMFTMIGDDLRENYTTPGQRAALFEVAARLPGIGLVRGTTDAQGRPAIGVSMDDAENRIRTTLLFAPGSYELLGERESVLDGNSFGYPQGTLIGQASYLEQSVVDSVPSAVTG